MTELTTAERKAQGKAARAKAPLESHADIGPDAGRDPVGLIIGQAATRVPGAGADPARPDARLAVHLLPRRCAADGGGPVAHAVVGAAGAAVR